MRRLSVFLLLFLVLGAAPMTKSAEAAKASLTIHYRWCPYGYVHQEYAALCHDDPLANNTMGVMSSAGYIVEKTDANGNLTLSLDPNTYEIFIGIAADFSLDEYRVCTLTGHPDSEIHGPLVLSAGDDVTCDYSYVGGGGRSSLPADDTLPPGAGHVRAFFALFCEGGPTIADPKTSPFPPRDCATQAGIGLSISTGDGRTIGSCITEDSGYCALHINVGAVMVTEDVNSAPLGRAHYAPQANPLLQDVSSGPGVIVNTPDNLLPTVAPADSSITVHGRVCPPGYSGENYFSDCHGNSPDHRQMMFLQGQLGGADYLAKSIDADGNLTFSELLPERYQLLLGLPPDTVSTHVVCSKTGPTQTDFETQTTSSLGWSSTSIDLGPGEDIVCDAYTIPPAA